MMGHAEPDHEARVPVIDMMRTRRFPALDAGCRHEPPPPNEHACVRPADLPASRLASRPIQSRGPPSPSIRSLAGRAPAPRRADPRSNPAARAHAVGSHATRWCGAYHRNMFPWKHSGRSCPLRANPEKEWGKMPRPRSGGWGGRKATRPAPHVSSAGPRIAILGPVAASRLEFGRVARAHRCILTDCSEKTRTGPERSSVGSLQICVRARVSASP